MFATPLGILAMAQPSGAGGQSSLLSLLVPFALVFLIFYFILFRPMRRQQKDREKMISELKAGDRVVTNGGLYGTITGVTDKVVHLKIADQVRVEVSKSAIAGLQEKQ